ncbi:MAG: arylesterase [Pseudomonadota bacterium]
MLSRAVCVCLALQLGASAGVLNRWDVAQGAVAAESCRITFLGDSLTAGFGLPDEASWPARMADRLAAEDIPCAVVNAGVSGDTTAGGRARLGWLLAEQPTHVVLALGANDGLRALPVDDMADNLDAMLTELAAADVTVLLAGMLAPPNLGEDYGRRFADAFEDVAAHHDVAFYPFLLDGVAGDPALNQPDGIHPNPRGVEVMVERIWPTFGAWLEATGVADG